MYWWPDRIYPPPSPYPPPDEGNFVANVPTALAVFQDPYAYTGIRKSNGRTYVVMVNNGKPVDSTAVHASTVYLRAAADYGTSRASFAYSLDNQSFNTIGDELEMEFNLSVFTGNKFCLFNYATRATGGYVDFDWFRAGMPASIGVAP